MKLFFRSKSEKNVVPETTGNTEDRQDVPVKAATSRGMSKQGSKGGGLFSKSKSKTLVTEDGQSGGSAAGGSGDLQKGKGSGGSGSLSRGKSKSGAPDGANAGGGNPAANAGQAPPKSGPPQARGVGPYIPGQTPPPAAAKGGPGASNAAGGGPSSGDGTMARTKSGKPIEGGAGDMARTKSGKAVDGAGGDIARTKSGKTIESKDPKEMTIDEMNEKSKEARIAAEQLEKDNEELEAQAPPVEQILSEDQRLEDERIRCEHSLEKAKKLLKSIKSEKKMLDEGIASTGAIMAVERVGEKIKVVEEEELGERDEYEAMIKAIADQEHMINSLVSQIRRNPKLREPNIKVPSRYRVEYTPPPFRDWKVEKDYILKGLQPPTPAELKRNKSGGGGSGSKGSGSKGSGSKGSTGAGVGGGWYGALPDASRGSAINREGSDNKKQSKWEVKTNTLSKSASLRNEADKDKDRLSREGSSNVVHANEHSELDALKQQQSSVKNLFSRFDSGEIQKEAEKEHANKFANKEFDKSVFEAREHERAKALGSRHSSGKDVSNDAARELEGLKRMGSSNKDVIAAFEEGEVARQDSHDAEFKNKEMDFHERSVHVSKKFLL
eukprot:CAMPEP_0184692314 /NCGR_PEP_ID=MMETSP0313-20130426/846_1 /TAXON_ID=2792 /ORGANISM="Porphyridium aerugineum, Strain SAG 1380-2" /LENGTH=609 /DNA_ID=CAMNT_0027150139 /DNA_START=131 /DNA_END=1960 /DNA_ORIENTATION=+